MLKLCQVEMWGYDENKLQWTTAVSKCKYISLSHVFIHLCIYTRSPAGPSRSCVTEQTGFWQQCFVALSNSRFTVVHKYLFHVPSSHPGNTSEGGAEKLQREEHSNSLPLDFFQSTYLKCQPNKRLRFFPPSSSTARVQKIMSISLRRMLSNLTSCLFTQQ